MDWLGRVRCEACNIHGGEFVRRDEEASGGDSRASSRRLSKDDEVGLGV